MKLLSPRFYLYRLRHAPFRRQLVLVMSLGVMTVGAVTALLSTWQGSLQVRDTLVQQGLSLADSVAQQSQLALLTDSAENAGVPIERALAFPDVLQVELLHADGRQLLNRGKSVAMPVVTLKPGLKLAYLENENEVAWRFVAPVYTKPSDASPFEAPTSSPELLGYVRVTQGKLALSKLVRHLALINFGVGLALSSLLAWLLLALARRLSQPLNQLSAVMQQTGEG